jgi:hypothetical protein
MLHPLRVKQRDLKNPSCHISSEMWQEKDFCPSPECEAFFGF